jgi:hypothetical protein
VKRGRLDFLRPHEYTQGDEMTGTAVVAGHPQYSLGIRLTKKANL